MSTQLLTIAEDESLELANLEMEAARLRHIPIVERSRPDHLVGIVTQRDLLRVAGRALAETAPGVRDSMLRQVPVCDVMSRDVQTARPDESAASAARRMLDRKIGCLPVVNERGALVGIITESDFVHFALDRLEGAA